MVDILEALGEDTGTETKKPKPDKAPDVPADVSWSEALGYAAENIPASAARFAGDIKEAVTNPMQTVESLGNIAFGLVDKIMPEEQVGEGGEIRARAVDTLTTHLRDRYGSEEAIKQTLATDPVGFAADVASVLIPMGETIRAAGTAAKMPGVASVGSRIAKTGALADPLQTSANILRKVGGSLIPVDLPPAMYQKAVKFSTTIAPEKRHLLAELALDEQIMPKMKGLYKLADQINEYKDKIDSAISGAIGSGLTTNIDNLTQPLDALRDRATQAEQIRAINRVEKNLRAVNEGKDLSPQRVQDIKVDIYRDLENYYKNEKMGNYGVRANKAVARAAKETLEGWVPELKDLNRGQGIRLELMRELERAVGRIENQNFIQLTPAAIAGPGAVVGGPGGLAATAAIGVIGKNRAELASIFNKLKKFNPEWEPSKALVRMGLVEPARADMIEDEE